MATRLWLGIIALCLAPAAARASNGGHPRTPVDWSQVDVACQAIVDRSVDPVWHLEYGIPFEDTEVTADEVADSRRHQFFALCQPLAPDASLPNWISAADIEDAATKDLVDPAAVDAEQVLESNKQWEGCWYRINGDDERRPITYAMAEQGVDWDTTGVPVGTYSIVGYTYEPSINIWIRRPGFVKVTDGEEPESLGPSAAISSEEMILREGEMGAVEGCVNALAGSTLTGYYASTHTEGGAAWEPEWVPFMVDAPIDGDTFSLEFVAPQELAGESAAIRVDVTDPEGRTYTAYMLEFIVVLGQTGGNGSCEGNGFLQDPSCTSGTGTGSSEPSTAGSTGEPEASTDSPTVGQDDPSNGGGCGCASTHRGSRGLGAFALMALALLRRRRA